MCVHEQFESSVTVDRLTEERDGQMEVTGYAADVQIRCVACELPFHFLGLPGGVAPDYPTSSFDGSEARLPIAPGIRSW